MNENRIQLAAEIADLDKKISSLKEGFDTEVGTDGLTFSGVKGKELQ